MSDVFDEPWDPSPELSAAELAEIRHALQPGAALASSEGHRRALRLCRRLVDALDAAVPNETVIEIIRAVRQRRAETMLPGVASVAALDALDEAIRTLGGEVSVR